MHCSKIKSIKYIGKKETYDITVNSEKHVYYANGIATSNSHSYSYAKVGYQTAWVKAHFPEQYICAWLKIAKNEAKPLEEIRGMMSEARRLKIKVYGPSARNLPKTDFFIKDGSVFFGLGSIKDCSDDSFKKIIDAGIDVSNMNWMDFLINASHYLSKSQMVPMIRTGCFDGFSLDSRTKCEFEYLQWNLLTPKQKETLREYYQSHKILSLIQLIQNFLDAEAVKASEVKKKETKTDKYKKHKEILYTLKRPPMDLRESTSNMIENEKQLLGINITCSHIERADIPIGTHSCSDINSSKFDKYKVYSIVGEICEFEEFKIKNGKLTGQTMANFKLYDSEDELDVVVFPEALDRFQAALYEGNIVLIKGKKSNRGGLILEEIYEV